MFKLPQPDNPVGMRGPCRRGQQVDAVTTTRSRERERLSARNFILRPGSHTSDIRRVVHFPSSSRL